MKPVAATRYDDVAMGLHWLIALLLIPMLFFGEEMIDAGKHHGNPLLPSAHVSIGLLIFALSVVRLAWRIANPPPEWPNMHAWERVAARTVHVLFYVLLIGLPITGWLVFPEFAREKELIGVTLFGLWPLPSAPNLGLPAEEMHKLGANIGIALLVLHVAAALKHQFVNRDGTLRRMLPSR